VGLRRRDLPIVGLENAFAHFGGVPRRLVIDNLKAAVARSDWYDPEIHPKLQSFARRYGTAFLPTKPYTPRHKGKVESGVKYVKRNALAGRTFKSLVEQNDFLLDWETRIADTRIHGTTKKQVAKLFEESERGALLPLPVERFPFFHEARRSVYRDGHVEVDKAFCSVPPEFVGRRLWVRWDSRLVRVFNHRWEQVAVHAKAEGKNNRNLRPPKRGQRVAQATVGVSEAWEDEENDHQQEQQRPRRQNRQGPAAFSPPHPAIPRWVAPLQSPTPFHQASPS
jgi:hypothetical protein